MLMVGGNMTRPFPQESRERGCPTLHTNINTMTFTESKYLCEHEVQQYRTKPHTRPHIELLSHPLPQGNPLPD